MGAWPESDVLKNGFGEWIWTLEDHTDLLTQFDRIDFENILAVQDDLPFGANRGDQLVHAVERANEGALPTAGRADDSRNLIAGDVDGDFIKSLEFSIE